MFRVAQPLVRGQWEMAGGVWCLRVVKWGTQMLHSKLEPALAFAFYFRKQSVDAIHYPYDQANVTVLKKFSAPLPHLCDTREDKRTRHMQT